MQEFNKAVVYKTKDAAFKWRESNTFMVTWNIYMLNILKNNTVTQPEAAGKDLYSDLICNTSRFKKAALP